VRGGGAERLLDERVPHPQEPLAVGGHRSAHLGRRVGHRKELEAVLEPELRGRTAASAFALLDGAGVPCEIATDTFGSG
jgi:hypothetical protein